MHPAHHESALAAFFRRHGLEAPYIDADGLIERHGLVLAMAFGLRAGGFRVTPLPDGGARINGETFTPAEVRATGLHEQDGEVHRAARLIEAIHDGAAPDPRGDMVDRMALIAIRLASADISVTPDMLLFEGIPFGIVAEYGLDAAQLAEAMKVAVNFWRRAARHRREAAAASRELVAA